MSIEPATPPRSILSQIFLSPNEPRLRAGWRLLIQTLLLLAFGIVVSLGSLVIANLLNTSLDNFMLSEIAEFIVVTGSVFLARVWLDKRSIASLGLEFNRWILWDILAGILITFIVMGFIFLAMSALGWITFQAFSWQNEPIFGVITNVLVFLIIFIFVGWNEELLSRGYHLQTLESGLNLTWGVILSSTVFGLLHLGNPNATWVSAAGIFFAGLFLAYGYIRTKQLWLSIGLHIGWNLFEGVVFGFPVSGLNIYPLMQIQVHGPELWTGGAFGPEAGLIVLPGLLIGAILIYVYTSWLRRESE